MVRCWYARCTAASSTCGVAATSAITPIITIATNMCAVALVSSTDFRVIGAACTGVPIGASGPATPGKVIGPSFAAEEVADVVEAVIDAGLDHYSYSFDAPTREKYREIIQVDNFDKAWANLERCVWCVE